MRIIRLFLFGALLFGMFQIVEANEDRQDIKKTTHEILMLGKKIEKNRSSRLGEKMFLERERLFQRLRESFERIDTRILKKPTLDVSSRYNFVLQKYSLSCEIAALKIILEARENILISEEQILAGIPIFPGPLSANAIWGDPDKEFVGSYTGSQRKFTGYGVYEKPLAIFLKKNNIASEIKNRFDGTNTAPRVRMQEALESLHRGDHVLLWGDWCTTPRHEDGLVDAIDSYIAKKIFLPAKNPCYREASDRIFTWTTPEGKRIQGISGEHAFVLIGYIGNIDRPTHIIVWDTDTGRHIYPYSEWMRKWNLLDYRSLTIPKKI